MISISSITALALTLFIIEVTLGSFVNYSFGNSFSNLTNNENQPFEYKDNKPFEYTDTNQTFNQIPFYIQYPKHWGVEQGSVEEYEYVSFSNPQNTSYFQIFYNAKITNPEDITVKKYKEIKDNNKIINTYEKSINTTNKTNKLSGKEIYYEYIDNNKTFVKDRYIVLVNGNGTFVLNPITYNTSNTYNKVFDSMIESFVPYKVENQDQGISIEEIKGYATDMSYDNLNSKIYFIHDNNELGIYDLKSHQLVQDIDIEEGATNIDYSITQNKLFITNSLTKQISIFNVTDNSINLTNKVKLMDASSLNISRFTGSNTAIDDTNKIIFIVFSDSDNITKMDYNGKILETIPVKGKSNVNYDVNDLQILDIGLDSFNDNNYIFISDPSDEKVKVIDDKTNKIIMEIKAGGKVNSLSIDSFYNKLYVTTENHLNIYDILNQNNLTSINHIHKIPIEYPTDTIINPISHLLYIPLFYSDQISVIDPFNPYVKINTIDTDNAPFYIVFSDEDNIGYVTHKGSNTITIFNGTDNRLLYFVNFQMSPENAGKVICGDKVFAGNTSLFLEPKIPCNIIPNEGYRYSSYNIHNNIDDYLETANNQNGNYGINSNYNNGSFIDSLSDTLINPVKQLLGFETNNNSSSFMISTNGVYLFNFIHEQQIPKEFWTPFYGILASFLIPFIIREIIEKRKSHKDESSQIKQRHLFIDFNKTLNGLHDDIEKDNDTYDENIKKSLKKDRINQITETIVKDFKLGYLTESQYNNLLNKIQTLSDD